MRSSWTRSAAVTRVIRTIALCAVLASPTPGARAASGPLSASTVRPDSPASPAAARDSSCALEIAFGPGFPIPLVPQGGGSGAPPYPEQAAPGFGQPGQPKNEQSSSIVELPNENYYIPALGMKVRPAVGRVSNGLVVQGLAVVSLTPDTPAARSGLRALDAEPHRSREGLITLAAVVTGTFFPPALYLWAYSMNDENRIGRGNDFIVGIDGQRAAHILDLDEELRAAKPGDIVYFNVMRDGKHVQVPVQLAPAPAAPAAASKSALSKPPAKPATAAPAKTSSR